MKRWIILVLVIVSAFPIAALALIDGDENLLTQSQISSSMWNDLGVQSIQMIDWHGETCYIYADNMSVYTYHMDSGIQKLCQLPCLPEAFTKTIVVVGDEERSALQETVSYIVASDNGLYGYNQYNGRFGSIDTEGIQWSDTVLDITPINPERGLYPNRVARNILTEKRLYTLISMIYEDVDHYAFCGFDITSGQAIEYPIDDAVAVCHQEDERFLFLRKTKSGYVLSQFDTETLIQIDLPISMEVFPLEATVGGLAYIAANNTICLSMKGKVYRSVDGGAFVPISYIPTDTLMNDSAAWLLHGGRYALCTMTGLYLRVEADMSEHGQVVVQAAGSLDETKNTFEQMHPDIELHTYFDPITAEALAQRLTSKDESVDIYELCVDHTYAALVKKGLVANLSSSEQLCNEAETIDSTIAAALRDEEGRLIAYPSQLRIWTCGIHEGYWQLIFGDRPLPANMAEVMDAWLDFELLYADEYPDMEFVLGFDYAQFCQKIITFYVQQHDVPDQAPDLSDAELSHVLDQLKQVYEIRLQAGRPTTELTPDQEDGTASILRFRGGDDAMRERSSLFALTSENSLYDMYMFDYTPITLSFGKTDTPKTDGTLYVYIVNPYSRNQEAAIHFVECAAMTESKPYLYYALHPNCNVPYENPSFERQIANAVEQKAELEDIKKQLDGMELAEISNLQAMIDYYDLYLQNQESSRWLISAQTIDKHRALLQKLDIHKDSIYLGAEGSASEMMIKELCARYADGGLTTEAFLREMTNKMKLMQLEKE